MKKILLFTIFSISTSWLTAQFVYKIKADSVKITNDSCSAELILENSTKHIQGFLYNRGNGRTEFRTGSSIGDFILNQNVSAQSANSWISGNHRIDNGGISINKVRNLSLSFDGTVNTNASTGIRFENTNTGTNAFSVLQLGEDINNTGTKFLNILYGNSGTIEGPSVDVYRKGGASLVNNGNGGIGISSNGTGNIRFYHNGITSSNLVLSLNSTKADFIIPVETNNYIKPGSLSSNPTGQNGMIYYNSTAARLRSYINSTWQSIVTSGDVQNGLIYNSSNNKLEWGGTGYSDGRLNRDTYINTYDGTTDRKLIINTQTSVNNGGLFLQIDRTHGAMFRGEANGFNGQTPVVLRVGNFDENGNDSWESNNTSTLTTQEILHNGWGSNGNFKGLLVRMNGGNMDNNYGLTGIEVNTRHHYTNSVNVNGTAKNIALKITANSVGAHNWLKALTYAIYADSGRVYSRDSVMFGTTTPGAFFHVNGSSRFDLGGDATGDIFYRNSSGQFTKLPIGTNNYVLTSNGTTPSWQPSSGGGGGSRFGVAGEDASANETRSIDMNDHDFAVTDANSVYLELSLPGKYGYINIDPSGSTGWHQSATGVGQTEMLMNLDGHPDILIKAQKTGEDGTITVSSDQIRFYQNSGMIYIDSLSHTTDSTAKYLLVKDRGTDKVYTLPYNSILGGGGSQNLQQVLTAGGTLTTNNTINNGTNTLSINGSGSNPSLSIYAPTIGLQATSDIGGIPIRTISISSATNTYENNITLYNASAGTTAAGFGGSIAWMLERDNNSVVVSNKIVGKWETSTAGSETSQFDLYALDNGSERTFMNIQKNLVRINNNADTLATKAYARSVGGSGGVTDGDKGDITVSSGIWTIDNDAVTYGKLQNISATQRVLGRNTSGAGDAEEVTLSQLLDWVGSAAQGDILYRNGSSWTRLAAGTSGQVLQTNGTGANPSWVTPSSGSGFSLVKKTSDENRSSSTTLTNDAALTISFSQTGLYHVRGKVFFSTANATMDYKYALTTSGTAVMCKATHAAAGAGAGTDNETTVAQSSMIGSTSVTANTSGIGYVEIDVVISITSSGTFAFQWAQNTSNGSNLTVLKGSYLEYSQF